ncbi:ABC transporter permease [Limibacter armeniacum]|uniref:MlaE family ABC transporter permease n=1 Tax=Limibacter armeniacum TaxID=466084 RepID=UPI002FE5B57F
MKTLGRYMLFMGKLFVNREPIKVYWQRFVDECIQVGNNSIFIVSIISLFVGAVIVVQMLNALDNPLIPITIVGFAEREMVVLEFAPTVTAIILAGKVGSNIASELGTMRISEQIDALEVMGINSASYLVLPKIIAGIVMFPPLVILSASLSVAGGYILIILTKLMTLEDYINGLRMQFDPFTVPFALIKAFVFGFIVTSVSAFEGYHTKGGALEVGQSSTKAFNNSSILILFADLLLANLLL